ncbi:cell division protein FtsX [Gluconobacter frateurii]|uniref:cell division protein FtsX n=1 Tax=Gluconobacter frateurii TaxID=38308 RepID=UPI001F06B0C9|nr:FtsX-like permease family protein [Gluconobacter frateurii]UMM08781.1 cell division protein FtsX [Gluconobacter frateurii]
MSRRVSPGLRSGSLPLLVALMTLLAGLALAGLSGIQSLAEGWSQAARSAATIEIPTDIPNASDRTEALVHALKALDGVTNIQKLSTDKVQDLLAPWLGQPVGSHRGLPGLSLPEVLIVAHTRGIDLSATVHDALPEAIVQEDLQWGQRLERLGTSLTGCAWLAVILIAAIAILSIGITVRRSVAAQKRAVDIVHSLGAADLTISSHIAGRAALLSFLGGVAGLILLTPLTTSLATTLSPFARQSALPAVFPTTLDGWWTTLGILPPSLLKELGALPFIAACLGWLTAQGVVLVWLRRLP